MTMITVILIVIVDFNKVYFAERNVRVAVSVKVLFLLCDVHTFSFLYEL